MSSSRCRVRSHAKVEVHGGTLDEVHLHHILVEQGEYLCEALLQNEGEVVGRTVSSTCEGLTMRMGISRFFCTRARMTLPGNAGSRKQRTWRGIFLFWSGLMVLGWITCAPL